METVEYLIAKDPKDGFSSDKNLFISLISSHSKISFKENKIWYESSSFDFSIEDYNVQNPSLVIFHLIIRSENDDQNFQKLRREIRKIVKAVGFEIQLIWDDVSRNRSIELYPFLYNLENKLRKLISKFMLLNVGLDWYNKTLSSKIERSNRLDSNGKTLNILYELNFDGLTRFLFDEYPFQTNLNALKDGIDKKSKSQILNLIEDFIPKNNWARYFSKFVKVDESKLKNQLNEIYKIRNKIAHNTLITNDDFSKGKKLCNEITVVIDKAITNIGIIKMENEEILSISNSAINSMNKQLKIQINEYIKLNSSFALVDKIYNSLNALGLSKSFLETASSGEY
ncbi:MAG: HEPN domain-containing protein [Saprospiraceae bacterium]